MLTLLLLAVFVWLLFKLSASAWTVLLWLAAIALVWALVAYLLLPLLAVAVIGGGAYWLIKRLA